MQRSKEWASLSLTLWGQLEQGCQGWELVKGPGPWVSLSQPSSCLACSWGAPPTHALLPLARLGSKAVAVYQAGALADL